MKGGQMPNDLMLSAVVLSSDYNETVNKTACDYCGTTVWLCVGIVISFVTILGNVLTLSAILISKKLSSTIANYFVFSLAVSDFFVGCFVPYHMLFYVDPDLNYKQVPCLLRFSLISFACASSISNIVLIAGDRYVAIVYPFHYSRYITKKVTFTSIGIAWLASFTLATVPILWNEWSDGMACEAFNVLPYNYIKYLLCPMFVVIWMTMLFLYSRICKEATGHEKRIRNSTSTCSSLQTAVHLKESKSMKMTLMILGCFTLCWFPYFVITLYARVTGYGHKMSSLYEIFFNLAITNSGMNPMIYAWKNANFRKAFKSLLRCQTPNQYNTTNFITDHVPSKKNSINGISNAVCNNDENSREAIELPTVYYPEGSRECVEDHSDNSEDSGLQMKITNENKHEYIVKSECEVHELKKY